MRGLTIVTGACVIGTSGAAMANPIMMIDEAYAQQFPHTAHVQLTRELAMSPLSTIDIIRDGQAVTATTLRSATTSADLGSGVRDIYWAMACDCNVPIGQHSYSVGGKSLQVEVVDAAAANGALQHFSASCDTECASVVPVPPEGGSGGEGGAGGAAGEGGAGPQVSAGGLSGASGAAGAAEASGGTTPTGGRGGTVPEQTGGSSATGGAATGGRATETGGTATGGTKSATGGTHSVTEPADTGGTSSEALATGGSDASGAAGTARSAPVGPTAKKQGDSSGCTISQARGTLAPFGILAALGLLAWRRKK